MKFSSFEFENFRGIEKLKIDLGKSPVSPVYTLVGLNESGKTTVLEAINNFRANPEESLESLEIPSYKIEDLHTLIPISKRSNFNGKIIVRATLDLDEEDEQEIARFTRNDLKVEKVGHVSNIVIWQEYTFNNSRYAKNESSTWWRFTFLVKEFGKRKSRYITKEERQKIMNFAPKLMPSILYFPNFLFEFPDKIYLENTGGDPAKMKFYRLVVQDILDSLNNDLDLETHILKRAKSTDINDKKHLENLLLEMSRDVTKKVFDEWKKIFHTKISDKKIVISGEYDSNKNYYLQFRLEDSDGYYLINERSLGFRWFFVFLLLTQYRGFRKGGAKNVLFLFDEPASNLHPSAQTQLLECFKTISKKCSIMYTTHSHYLINTEWLEGTFIVKNLGIDYASDSDNYSAKKTNITVQRYREFITEHPLQTSYYKPILDVLEWAPSKIEWIPDVVMLEGKNDFYTLTYLQNQESEKERRKKYLPGVTASGLDSVIKLYLAWNYEFIILLDADEEGYKQKARYKEIFGSILDDRVFTLEDIDTAWSKFELEDVIAESDRLLIQKTVFPESEKYNKHSFNRAVQELLLKDTAVSISEPTRVAVRKILDFCKAKLVKTV